MPLYGCTDPTAYNYKAWADTDDGSCVYGKSLYECISYGGYYEDQWKMRCKSEYLGSMDYLGEPYFDLYPHGHYGDNNNVWNQVTSGPYYIKPMKAYDYGRFSRGDMEGEWIEAPWTCQGIFGEGCLDETWSGRTNFDSSNQAPSGNFMVTGNSYMRANFEAETGTVLGDKHHIARAVNSNMNGQGLTQRWRSHPNTSVAYAWHPHTDTNKDMTTPASFFMDQRYIANAGTALNPHTGNGWQTWEMSAWIKGASSVWGTTGSMQFSNPLAGSYTGVGQDNMWDYTFYDGGSSQTRHVYQGANAQFDLWLFTLSDGNQEYFPTRQNYNGEHYNAAINSTNKRMSVRLRGTATSTWTYWSTRLTIRNDQVTSPDKNGYYDKAGYISSRLDVNTHASITFSSLKGGGTMTEITYPVVYIAGWSIRPLNVSMASEVNCHYAEGGSYFGSYDAERYLSGSRNISLEQNLRSLNSANFPYGDDQSWDAHGTGYDHLPV